MATKSTSARWKQPGRRWDETDARAALEALAASKLTQEEFARQNGFTAQRLHWWRRSFSESSEGDEMARATLVPVVVRGGNGSGDAPRSESASVVVRVGRAVVELRDTPRIDSEWLARFVLDLGGER